MRLVRNIVLLTVVSLVLGFAESLWFFYKLPRPENWWVWFALFWGGSVPVMWLLLRRSQMPLGRKLLTAGAIFLAVSTIEDVGFFLCDAWVNGISEFPANLTVNNQWREQWMGFVGRVFEIPIPLGYLLTLLAAAGIAPRRVK